jgi:four helix bundle protein
MRLVRAVYAVTKAFPSEEQFGLAFQLRKAAVSVPSNIAEGGARSSKREFLHFPSIARGSFAEMETQVIIARDLGYQVNDSDDLLGAVAELMLPSPL